MTKSEIEFENTGELNTPSGQARSSRGRDALSAAFECRWNELVFYTFGG